MTRLPRLPHILLAASGLFAALPALAQQPYPPSGGRESCQRLEAQLAAIDRSAGDPARAEQIRRYEEMLGRQQAELDRTSAQLRRLGCEASGFFQIFGGVGRSEQCGPLQNQIQQMRANLARVQNDLQRLQGAGANYERDGQRRSVLAALAQNDCGPQYRAQAAQSRNLFEALFGADQQVAQPSEGSGSGYRTLCVRTCDGYFFPISFSTSQDRFRDDETTCQRMCPASEVVLYSHRNPGEDIRQAVSSDGRNYSELPNAFKYKSEWNASCTCKAPGESWANAVKEDPATQTTLERGDIVVTEERAKQLNAPRDAKGRPILPQQQKQGRATQAAAPGPAPEPQQAEQPEGEKKPIRSVGPKFLSQ